MKLGNFFGMGPSSKKEAAVKIADLIKELAPGVSQSEGTVAARNQAEAVLQKAREGFEMAGEDNAQSLLVKTLLSAMVTQSKTVQIYEGDRSTLKQAPLVFDAAKDSLEQIKTTPVILSKDDEPIRTRVLDKDIDARIAALEKVESLFKNLSTRFPSQPAPAAKTEHHARLDL